MRLRGNPRSKKCFGPAGLCRGTRPRVYRQAGDNAREDAAADLVRPLWRALVVFRVLTWVFACAGVVMNWDDFVRPWGAAVLMGVMAVWTAVVAVGYLRGSGQLAPSV